MKNKNGFFGIILSTIANKVRPLLNRIRLWRDKSYVTTRIKGLFQTFINKTINVKPKHQKDYYDIFKWQVSKKLAYFIVIIIGVLCAAYLFTLTSAYFSNGEDSISTYRYNNVLLRFCNDKVRIKGKSGYIAYVGDVKKGACNGKGSLYRKDGSLVYEGEFANSMFEGTGKSYFESGVMAYEGSYHENLYSGTGNQYRENSNIWYKGDFVEGNKQGHGELYDNGGNLVYSGTFSMNRPMLSELLGNTTAEAAEHYKGTGEVYSYDDEKGFVVDMPEIDAMYLGHQRVGAIEDDVVVDMVYMLSDKFEIGNICATNLAELEEALGEPLFEGNAYINTGEALAINKLCQKKGNVQHGRVQLDEEYVFEDYTTLKGYDDTYMIYIYGYELDGVTYTFVANKQKTGFDFYFMQTTEASEEEEE